MPHWIVNELNKSFRLWKEYHVKSLDEAFQITREKGLHISSKRKILDKVIIVIYLVNKRAKNGEPIDEYLFECVGKELNISSALARKYYYEKLVDVSGHEFSIALESLNNYLGGDENSAVDEDILIAIKELCNLSSKSNNKDS